MNLNSSSANRLLLSALLSAASITLTAEYAAAADPVILTPNVDYSVSIFDWDLNANSASQTTPLPISPAAANYDEVIGKSNKTLTVTTDATFNVILGTGVDPGNVFWNSIQSWKVFSGFGSGTGSFAITQPTNRIPPGSFSVSPVTNGAVTLTYTPVPEPSSVFAGLLLGAGLLRRKRR